MAFKPLFDVENIYDLKDCSDEDHFWLMIGDDLTLDSEQLRHHSDR